MDTMNIKRGKDYTLVLEREDKSLWLRTKHDQPYSDGHPRYEVYIELSKDEALALYHALFRALDEMNRKPKKKP